MIDLHSAGREGTLVPLSGFREAQDDCARRSALAAAAFGLEHYWMMRWAPGTLSTWANQLGIPAVGCEVGGRAEATREQIDLYKKWEYAAACATSACSTRPWRSPCRPKCGRKSTFSPHAAGLLESLVRLGQEVEDGEILARVRESLGNRLRRNHCAARRQDHAHPRPAVSSSG